MQSVTDASHASSISAFLAAPLLVALIGYGVKYFNDIIIDKRKFEIDLLSQQIKKLYGPLYSLSTDAASSWHTFRERIAPNRVSFFFDKSNPPTGRSA
jgi:hypothetical protein